MPIIGGLPPAIIKMLPSLSRGPSITGSPSREEQRRKKEIEDGGNPDELSKLYSQLSEAELNFNEMDIRDILIRIGDYFLAKSDAERSLNNFLLAYSKAGTTDIKIDITLKIMLIGF